ncbi:murein L,D-transpeptidase catalytic domain family protein [Chitinophaga japonensis]|uniref:L,D-transpeptidase-like protein n=1 Tax=Chitinophaga japonensis TaxID=104662 RepID=A0A562TDF7_CHIJA|nr:murein L,D-transpeptidase catalytic domain family protein [Chitinophaga japonensis]TWI91542.1 L,D-transpeptidase-like protein [Chitinophaga japonensis]
MRVPKPKQNRKLLIVSLTLFTLLLAINVSTTGHKAAKVKTVKTVTRNNNTHTAAALYDSLQLGSLGLSQEAFAYGMQGFQRLLAKGRLQNDSVIAIVDYSLPSTRKRLFVIDIRNGRVLFNTLVSHGRNSGKVKATSFSNKPNSYKSSLGFYVTDRTYIGGHGLSLRLRGTEKGINDNAMQRAIVIHGADYVDEDLISSQGYIGRSLGCPALPVDVHRKVIEAIKNGTCLFLYSPNKSYIARSKMLQQAQTEFALSTPVM